MCEEVGAEVKEASLGGLHKIADKGQWVFEYALKGSACFLDVFERAGADNVKDDFEQVPGRVRAPTYELPQEANEHFAQLNKCLRDKDDVFEGERFERRDELRRDLADDREKLGLGGLEPLPAARNRF